MILLPINPTVILWRWSVTSGLVNTIHRVVKVINLVILYYTHIAGRHMPVNYRICDKSEGKTKNDYFREMLLEVLAWGLKPAFVTGDSWYSCVKNLKTIKNHQTVFMFAVESNRTVALEKGQWQ